MVSAPDDSSLSSDQDTNQFLVQAGIEPQISYTTIRDFTSCANQNSQHGPILLDGVNKVFYIMSLIEFNLLVFIYGFG